MAGHSIWYQCPTRLYQRKLCCIWLQSEVQERQVTNRTECIIVHQDDTHYIVNLHGLHNAHLLRQIFPSSPDLLMSKPISEDRQALHFGLATHLCTLDAVRKMAAREKRETTKRRKAAEKATGTAEGMSRKPQT